MNPYYDHAGIQIFHGDCREILPHLPKVDLVFTSPPYMQQRDYTGVDEWNDLVPPAIRIVAPSAQVFVNLGLIYRDGSLIEYWRPLLDGMGIDGWRLFGWYVWDQGFGLPGDWNGRLAPSHEFIFHFNREPRTPNKTAICSSVGRRITGTGLRRADGTTRGRMSSHGKKTGLHKIKDSVIRITREASRVGPQMEHPAVFPIAFPSELIAAYTQYGEVVLDPFMGSGTTLVAAKQLGRRAIGIEIEEKYCEIAVDRLEARKNFKEVNGRRSTWEPLLT